VGPVRANIPDERSESASAAAIFSRIACAVSGSSERIA
jgi:hypothetical protein